MAIPNPVVAKRSFIFLVAGGHSYSWLPQYPGTITFPTKKVTELARFKMQRHFPIGKDKLIYCKS